MKLSNCIHGDSKCLYAFHDLTIFVMLLKALVILGTCFSHYFTILGGSNVSCQLTDVGMIHLFLSISLCAHI